MKFKEIKKENENKSEDASFVYKKSSLLGRKKFFVILLIFLLLFVLLTSFLYFSKTGLNKDLVTRDIENKETLFNVDNKKLSQEEINVFINNEFKDLYNKGELDKLESILSEKIKSNPESADLLAALGIVYAQENVYNYKPQEAATRARVYLEKALKISPNYPTALMGMGYSYEITGQFEQAIGYYEKAIQQDKNNASYYTQLGHAYEMKGDVQKAIDNYVKALGLSKNAATYSNIARLYGKVGYRDMAIENYKRAIVLSENIEQKSGIYASLGSIYTNSSKRTEEDKKLAIEYLNEALRINDKNSLAYANLLEEYYKRMGEVKTQAELQAVSKKIEEYFKKAQEINPRESIIYFYYGLTLAILGEYQGAYDTFEVGLFRTSQDMRLFGDEKERQKAKFYMGESVLLALGYKTEDDLNKFFEKLNAALKITPALFNDFIQVELKKPNGGYWSRVKDDARFQEMVKNFSQKK